MNNDNTAVNTKFWWARSNYSSRIKVSSMATSYSMYANADILDINTPNIAKHKVKYHHWLEHQQWTRCCISFLSCERGVRINAGIGSPTIFIFWVVSSRIMESNGFVCKCP